jgi:SAM-dependent methyltransferase
MSYEPGELGKVLPAGARHIVSDISSAVVEAVGRQYPAVEACVYDFAEHPYPVPADAIVCLCVLVRAREPRKIFRNLYQSLKPGGLLVMDNRSCTHFGGPEFPLERLSGQVWRKPR